MNKNLLLQIGTLNTTFRQVLVMYHKSVLEGKYQTFEIIKYLIFAK